MVKVRAYGFAGGVRRLYWLELEYFGGHASVREPDREGLRLLDIP